MKYISHVHLVKAHVWKGEARSKTPGVTEEPSVCYVHVRPIRFFAASCTSCKSRMLPISARDGHCPMVPRCSVSLNSCLLSMLRPPLSANLQLLPFVTIIKGSSFSSSSKVVTGVVIFQPDDE